METLKNAGLWILSEICTFIFILAEDLWINLGRLTVPIVAGMFGSWPHKVVEEPDRLPDCPDCGHNFDWHNEDGCTLSYCRCRTPAPANKELH